MFNYGRIVLYSLRDLFNLVNVFLSFFFFCRKRPTAEEAMKNAWLQVKKNKALLFGKFIGEIPIPPGNVSFNP